MATATTRATPTLISSLPDLRVFLSSIPPSSTFYLDLEGKSLSRNGTLTLLTVHVLPSQATGIVDVQTLGDSAFTTPGIEDGNTTTLKAILEDPHTSKCFWDVRNDADALWAHHKVRLAGVTDVQLLENASRAGNKTYLSGLDKCIEKDLQLKFKEVHRLVKTKKEVRDLMATDDIFSRRPVNAKTMQYCVNDVVHLPALHNLYAKRITSNWLKKAMDHSARRVVEACGPAYQPQSDHKKFGPWSAGLGKEALAKKKKRLGKKQLGKKQLEKKRLEEKEEDEAIAYEYSRYFDCDHGDPMGSANEAAWDFTFDSC